MIIIQGKSVYNGIAIGKIAFFKRSKINTEKYTIKNSSIEIERFNRAKKKSIEQLKSLYDKALQETGEENAQIFEIHQMMIEDDDYNQSIVDIINNEKVNSEYAVSETCRNFSEMFSSMEDEYMNARAVDVKDISNRILKNLLGGNVENVTNEKCIICADDLAPSETIQLDKSSVLAFVTSKGSANSHTSILARTMNIPAIIGTGDTLLNPEYDGKMAIVDGYNGAIYIEPDEPTLKTMRYRLQDDINKRLALNGLKGKSNTTIDGTTINVFANISGVGDIEKVIENDANGIGLFRSEFLYLESSDFPSEEKQFASYKKVLQAMGDKKVIVRTLDIGADKQIGYFNLEKEENPAMGYRAIRICLDRQHIFKTQLRALFRASVYGNLAIMFPMIISREEIVQIKSIIEVVKDELRKENIPFNDDIEIGIMIETPASAIISDILASEVDFFSIGTNDLSQYTLAIDRQNNHLEQFFNPHHEAILRLMKFTIDNAHKNNIWVGICGELGGDLSLTETFLKMGVDELSVSAPKVLQIRNKIRSIDLSK
ncbi:MAG: phosphoenolpyruvate--protein phosphotransferase [Oscillospiraceae bacterium]